MEARTNAAPPTPWSQNLVSGKIDESAKVHAFSHIVGDVEVGPKASIAPGTDIRADEGTPFYIGEATSIQDGAIIHGLQKGKVVGDNGKEYSVWIGKHACISHLALIHGPAYIGDGCFIGFRSTVFNARVGSGCIVMMHALIQDVEIPQGKYVPSGAIVTDQQQADRLPDVRTSDRAFVRSVIKIDEAFQAQATVTPTKERDDRGNLRPKENTYINSVGNMNVKSEIREQVRNLLSRGCKIGIEHACQRRFKTKSWMSDGPIQSQREDRVMQEIESRLAEYQGEYVRLIGIDPQGKRRVSETIIQRPEDKARDTSQKVTNSGARSYSAPASGSNGTLSQEILSQVRSLLEQGYKIGTESADERRFKTKSWQTHPSIESRHESEVVGYLESCLQECSGEYVRLIGIDSQAKRRVSETIIQRPDDKPQFHASKSTGTNYQSQNGTGSGSHHLSGDIVSEVRNLLKQGYKIGMEHASERRFKTKSWETCPAVDSQHEAEVVRQLEACMQEHPGEYVRLIGIDSQAKRRVSEKIVQRPHDKPTAKAPANQTSKSSFNSSSAYSSDRGSNNGSSAKLDTSLSREIIEQVRNLLRQGCKIGTEHATPRRFKTKSWETCTPVDSQKESDVIRYLEACLAEHRGEYVRLIGIDSQAKRRVSETIVQRP